MVRYCLKHKNRPAVMMCRQCHRPMCRSCCLTTRYGTFCSRGCARVHARFQKRYARLKGPRPRRHWSRSIWRLVALLLIVLLGIHFLQETYPCLRPYDLLGRCWP